MRRYGPGDVYGDDLHAGLELKGACVASSTDPSGLRVRNCKHSNFRFSLIGRYGQILVSYLLEEDSGSIFILHLAIDVLSIEGILNRIKLPGPCRVETGIK